MQVRLYRVGLLYYRNAIIGQLPSRTDSIEARKENTRVLGSVLGETYKITARIYNRDYQLAPRGLNEYWIAG